MTSSRAHSAVAAAALAGLFAAVPNAVVAEAAISPFRSATLDALGTRLARRDSLLPDLSKLHAMGHVALRQPRADYPNFWVAVPFDPRRRA